MDLRDFDAVQISTDEWTADGRIGDNRDIDRRMIDPMFARMAGDSSYPATRGPSGYADDPAYQGQSGRISLAFAIEILAAMVQDHD
ncbi:hypothetical protein [Micromonospora sp. RTP1Z1]|uniref:hypothetical protein n=1 Tax=Micromonospora sp. RTP1Z1 TaxID=2994043 RepID=UPI0029C86AF1|nr:hypothetical protein [Micromonospora sp. RTP1Z1]